MRIKDRRRFNKNMLILIFVVIISFICISQIVNQPKYNEKTIDYVVSRKETLWNIAEQYKKENQDTRDYIYQIKKINGDISTIYEGQVIKIIIYGEVK